MIASSLDIQPRRSFDPPQEPDWHRMIAEAAYFLAQKRGFLGERALEDWLAAEQQVRQVISPVAETEVTMDKTAPKKQPEADAKPQSTPQAQGASRFEKFAATQAAGDGVQGDTLKENKTAAEKIGANMADRK
jgi:Protein of unknown function (DUF2934)